MLITTVIWALAAAFSRSFAAEPDCLGHTPEPRSGRPQQEMSVSLIVHPSASWRLPGQSLGVNIADVGMEKTAVDESFSQRSDWLSDGAYRIRSVND